MYPWLSFLILTRRNPLPSSYTPLVLCVAKRNLEIRFSTSGRGRCSMPCVCSLSTSIVLIIACWMRLVWSEPYFFNYSHYILLWKRPAFIKTKSFGEGKLRRLCGCSRVNVSWQVWKGSTPLLGCAITSATVCDPIGGYDARPWSLRWQRWWSLLLRCAKITPPLPQVRSPVIGQQLT